MRVLDRPIAKFVAARCRLLGLSRRTCETYSYSLAAFEDWCGCSAEAASQEQAAAYQMAKAGSGAGWMSLFLNRCALVFLFRQMHGVELDPQLLPPMRRPKLRQVQIPDPWEVGTVLEAIGCPLMRLYCRFVYATGMRLQEAAHVRFADLDPVDRSVVVRRPKGGRQRRTILPDTLLAHLREHRRPWCGDTLIFSRDGSPVDADRVGDTANSWLARARRRTGLGRHLTVHRLRHAFATHLHERGVGLGELQRLLGHASIHTTMHYIGLREARRAEIAQVGDLLAALPSPEPRQQRISFTGED